MSKDESTDGPEASFDGVEQESAGLLSSSFQAVFSLVRPYAPQIIPIAVCVFFIPLILILSSFAGYIVWNSLSAGWHVPLYLQYGDGVSPYAQATVHTLHSQQRYDISLHLIVPAIESNYQLGNFMATLTLTTINNATLATIRRPAIAVPPKSGWFRGTPNVIDIKIPLLSAFTAGTSRIRAYVDLGRDDAWKSLGDGQGRELSVLAASLTGSAVPHGIRGLAIRFPMTSSLFAGFTFLMILTVVLGTCILPAVLPSQDGYADGTSGDEKTKRRAGTSSIAFPSSSDKVRKKRKSHVRRTTSEGSGMKQEEAFSMIPPADEPIPDRLRQRKISTKREPQDDVEI